ncbi:MAG TPA: hypothetical protein VMW83_12705 [Spirochaetia bacterium]|nr:hypothetical protein [Spirochaetia bacterium]
MDRSSPVFKTLAVILQACTEIEEPVTRYAEGCGDKPDIYRQLLRALNAADDLFQFALPDPDDAQLHGCTRDMLDGVKDPLVFRHREHPDWDFGPWFGGKASSVKSCTKDLVTLWLMDPEDYTGREEDGSRGLVRSRILQAFRGLQSYARLIFDQIYDEKLIIEGDE